MLQFNAFQLRCCLAPKTVDSLAARLGASAFLDDAHVLNGGNGKRGASSKRKRLNSSSYPAPMYLASTALVPSLASALVPSLKAVEPLRLSQVCGDVFNGFEGASVATASM